MFDELTSRIAGRFSRIEPRRRARAMLLGLLAELPGKNCWTLAEHAGDRTPDGMQHLLSRAVWDAGAVRDDLHDYVVEHLGTTGAVLVVDETGDLKKGTSTAGMQRQYTGTARRIENSQVAVFLAYSTPAGHAFIDRELYLPQTWTADTERCRAAGVPQDRAFATKGELATDMVARALDAGVQAEWVTGDEVYVKARTCVQSWKPARPATYSRSPPATAWPPAAGVCRADQVIFSVTQSSWQRLSAGAGAKGHRYYDWAFVETPVTPVPGRTYARAIASSRAGVRVKEGKARSGQRRAGRGHGVPVPGGRPTQCLQAGFVRLGRRVDPRTRRDVPPVAAQQSEATRKRIRRGIRGRTCGGVREEIHERAVRRPVLPASGRTAYAAGISTPAATAPPIWSNARLECGFVGSRHPFTRRLSRQIAR